ncbi:hypothetical protein [Crocinitomix catalasitica]|uniref:hypothetical protein n=1 Tax=Crocinitomix catalasitica TaxID=184607 RepID=UPI0004876F9A|nr:hypothetical protein [Crocinitomix catalasitica]
MKLLISVFILLPFLVNGQIVTATWGVSDTTVFVDRTTDVGVVHGYFEIFNYAERDLEMRWICQKAEDWPSDWDLVFTDPENYYPIVEHNDSADFLLTYPPGWANKLIYGMDHKGIAGTSSARFKVFPLDFPNDTIWLTYYFRMTDFIGAGIDDVVDLNTPAIHWNKSSLLLMLNNVPSGASLEVYSLTGQIILEQTNLSEQESIPFNTCVNGNISLAVIKDENGNVVLTRKLF